MTVLEFFSLFMAGYFTFLYIQTRFWIASNVFGMVFAIYFLENSLVGSFRTIFVLFVALTAYDAYFVFGSEMMVTVAKSFEAPLKLIVPYTYKFEKF